MIRERLAIMLDFACSHIVASSIPMLAFLGYKYYDYRKWIAFGQGNPPNVDNLFGYTFYEIQRALLDLQGASMLDTTPLRAAKDKRSFLPDRLKVKTEAVGDATVPLRHRPKLVHWILPHRLAPPYHHDKVVEARIRGLLKEVYDKLKDSVPGLKLGISRLEGIGESLYVDNPAGDSDSQIPTPPVCSDVRTCFNEIVHIHQQDLSFHVILSPLDAAHVIDSVRGERFAISGRRMGIGRLKGRIVPLGYLLLYTPKTLQDVEDAVDIIESAVRFAVSG